MKQSGHQPSTPYGITTGTLKYLSATFVGECHAASVKLSLPQTV